MAPGFGVANLMIGGGPLVGLSLGGLRAIWLWPLLLLVDVVVGRLLVVVLLLLILQLLALAVW